MSSDEDEVKLYNALERNQKRRQVFVTLSSSESEDDGVDTPPSKKRSRLSRGTESSPESASKPAVRSIPQSLVLEIDDENDDLYTAEEREKEMRRHFEIEQEIQRRLEQDTLLNQTRAIMSVSTSFQSQSTHDSVNKGVISLDSDDDDVQILGALSAPVQKIAAPPTTQNKGERITLNVRSNGSTTDEIAICMRDTFDVLYERFCDVHGLPRSAVQMSLDGEALRLSDTPESCDLESGDLIDAKVDFSKQDVRNKKQLLRLRLVVRDRRPETFRIDATSTLEKLHASFCKKHQISDPEDVELLSVGGDPLFLSQTIEESGLLDGDEISVEIKNFVDPSAIELRLRFDAKTTTTFHIAPSKKVEDLVRQIAEQRGTQPGLISLQLDGENMDPRSTLQYYDLEGGELIEVKIRS
ncbi:hypothetical protein Poli38472_005262 [Pythium oligandrum]|uniref:Ubiquitin-like domain-containing protein n=1 Tax=Pythium oligandrum TaxID=41045 RepID=A0A8K1CGK1_PYTOL|nr:hypothetical protein Poli38472_005262 [Pythium oligandrum]|eukprot:TMW62644.1 hypothetical protein Poli38472_005262 [Pythium oligandrum]